LPFLTTARVEVDLPETWTARLVLPYRPRGHDPPALAAATPRAPPV
jgi:hypothetical protein